VLNKDAKTSKSDSLQAAVTSVASTSTSAAEATGSKKRRGIRDKIQYQYDEHYFLTDPDEFIQEFLATDPQWQLLEVPISLQKFEDKPFVRSVFFHYGLEFEGLSKAVVVADEIGGVDVKIRVPPEYRDDLVFHYQLK